MARYLADTKLAELLPSSIQGDAGVEAAAGACQPELSAIVAATPKVLVYHNLAALPDAVLDLVAWGWHVDGYDLLESRAERLDLIRRFFDFHRFKGTKYGLGLYLRTFLKRELLAASPPHKSFLGCSLSESERAAWEAPHPEIRIYPFRHAGTKQGAVLGDYLGAMFPDVSDAILRIGDRVTLFDPVSDSEDALDSLATERDLVTRSAVRDVDVRLPGQAGRALFSGGFVGFLCDTGARSRFYRLRLEEGYADEIARRRPLSVRPSLEPVRMGSDQIGEPGSVCALHLGNRWKDVFSGRGGGFVVGFFRRSTAAERLYRRTKLFDPERVSFSRRETSTFFGAFRLGGFAPHTAEAAVDMRRTAPGKAQFCTGFLGCGHFAELEAGIWIGTMRRVGKMAVRFSDKIVVSITNHRPLRASSGLLAGDARAGEYRMEVL